jgi:quinol monooxygenase YgiN
LELFVFARFRAQEGQEAALAQAICESVTASREEAGCLNIHAFCSVSGPRLFYIGWLRNRALTLSFLPGAKAS